MRNATMVLVVAVMAMISGKANAQESQARLLDAGLRSPVAVNLELAPAAIGSGGDTAPTGWASLDPVAKGVIIGSGIMVAAGIVGAAYLMSQDGDSRSQPAHVTTNLPSSSDADPLRTLFAIFLIGSLL